LLFDDPLFSLFLFLIELHLVLLLELAHLFLVLLFFGFLLSFFLLDFALNPLYLQLLLLELGFLLVVFELLVVLALFVAHVLFEDTLLLQILKFLLLLLLPVLQLPHLAVEVVLVLDFIPVILALGLANLLVQVLFHFLGGFSFTFQLQLRVLLVEVSLIYIQSFPVLLKLLLLLVHQTLVVDLPRAVCVRDLGLALAPRLLRVLGDRADFLVAGGSLNLFLQPSQVALCYRVVLGKE